MWSCLDWYAKLASALPRPKPWNNESPDLKKALLDVFGERCDAAAARVRDDSTLSRLLEREVSAGDVLVSFNYDTILERLATRHPVVLNARPRGTSGVAFAKPHGSMSWTLDLTTNTLEWLAPDGTPHLQSRSNIDVDAGGEPLVLGAVPIKSELIREVQVAVPEVYGAVASQWRALVDALRDATAVVVVGYSFPSEDVYGRFLFREALALRTTPVDVEFYELPRFASVRAKEIFDVFTPYISTLTYRGPVVASGAT